MTKAELIYAITGDVERYLQAIKDDKPDHFANVGKMAEHIREDTKMIEPTDNTKIEELEAMGETKFEYGEPVPADWVMANKINEIINKVNAQTVVVLAHQKDIEEIKNDLDY